MKFLSLLVLSLYFFAYSAQTFASSCDLVLTQTRVVGPKYAAVELNFRLPGGEKGRFRAAKIDELFRTQGIRQISRGAWYSAKRMAEMDVATQVKVFVKIVNERQFDALFYAFRSEPDQPRIRSFEPEDPDVTPLRQEFEGYVEDRRITSQAVNLLQMLKDHRVARVRLNRVSRDISPMVVEDPEQVIDTLIHDSRVRFEVPQLVVQ